MSRAPPASISAQSSSPSQRQQQQQQQKQSDNGSSSQHTIGPWTLSREIGKGSFAVVFQGRLRPDYVGDSSGSGGSSEAGGGRRGGVLPKRVAIKIVTRKKLTPKLLENLEGEIAILKEIRHANVVELLDCLKSSSHIYLIMQYCYLGDLTSYIKTRRRDGQTDLARASRTPADSVFDQDQDHFVHPHDGGLHEVVVKSFLAQLAAALQFMRGKNIVHRDIKPQNLLLQEPETDSLAAGHPPLIPQLKVADFGFARHLPSASLAETLCGSPLYMAPEILRYQRYDAKADLWSVGAVLYEMCVGKPPFRALNHVELLKRIERGKDRIVFPDEKSDDTLRREMLRKDPESTEEVIRPHVVAEDLKALIRALLKKGPVERMSFDDFFASSVLAEYKEMERERQRELAVEGDKSKDRLDSLPTSPSTSQIQSSASLSASGSGTTGPTPSRMAGGTQTQPPLRQTSSNGSTASPQRQTVPLEHERKAPPPPPPVSSYYTTKYVVGGRSSHAKTKQAQTPATTPKMPASTGNAPTAASPTQRNIPTPRGKNASPRDTADASSLEDNVLETPGSSVTHLPGTAKAASRQASTTQPPGGSITFDEDGLGKGYVMVEKRNVEVNALADDLAGGAARASTSPSERVWGGLAGVVRRPSRLGRTPSTSSSNANPSIPESSACKEAQPAKSPVQAASSSSSSSPTAPLPATKFGTTPPSHNTPFALPPGARRPSFTRRPPSQETGIVPGSAPSSRGIAPPSVSGLATTLTSSSSSSALARAINMASVRLFGVPSGMSLRGAAALVNARSRRPFFISASSSPGGGGDVSEAEMNLLALLNDYGQKSHVICEFADAKLANYFSEGPHQISADASPYEDRPNASRTGSTAATRRFSSLSSSSLGRSPTGGSNYHQIHRQSSSSSVSSQSVTSQSEVAAAEALVLYVKSLSFLQRGIDATKTFIEARSLPGTSIVASPEINEVVQWLRVRFNDGYDRADFARSKCGEIPESAQNVDKLIFDKALEIARAAALDELENNREGEHWDCDRCILAYETASTMLLALLDPGEEALELSNGAFGTIEKFVKSIDKRLQCLQRKYQPSPST